MIRELFEIVVAMCIPLLVIGAFLAVTASLCLLVEYLSSYSTIVTDLIEVIVVSLCVIGVLYVIDYVQKHS